MIVDSEVSHVVLAKSHKELVENWRLQAKDFCSRVMYEYDRKIATDERLQDKTATYVCNNEPIMFMGHRLYQECGHNLVVSWHQ